MQELNTLLYKVVIVVFSYFIGSFPTGYIVYRAKKGGDIRREGSGNVGGTNVVRTVGALFGVATIIIDAVKGFIPILVVYFTFPGDLLLLSVVSVVTILGHDFPACLKFKGGKGIATSLGIVVGVCLLPFSQNPIWLRLLPLIIILFVALVVFLIVKIVSVMSLIAAIVTPFAFYFSRYPLPIVISSILWSVIAFIAHRENIKRLIRKEEKKIIR